MFVAAACYLAACCLMKINKLTKYRYIEYKSGIYICILIYTVMLSALLDLVHID